MKKITPFLWFDDNAEEAANFYVSIFKNSKILTPSGDDAEPDPEGSVTMVKFELEGQQFFALNGGPAYTFSPAISLFVDCETQAEVDDYWTRLSAGGEEVRCGWLRDKFGISWQIVPSILGELLQSDDREAAQRVMEEMLTQTKLDIARLKAAFETPAG